jgi:hypothetical protein
VVLEPVPGARCDFESIFYSYTFDEALQREWRWTERFAAQPEIRAYLNHVADRFDLRRSFRFNTRVTSAVWNEQTNRWTVRSDDGAVTTPGSSSNAAGAFSVFKKNDFPGQDDFHGTVLHTSQWAGRGRRFGRQAGGGGRHGVDWNPSHPDHRAAGRRADRVPAHRQLRLPPGQSAAYRRRLRTGCGGLLKKSAGVPQ